MNKRATGSGRSRHPRPQSIPSPNASISSMIEPTKITTMPAMSRKPDIDQPPLLRRAPGTLEPTQAGDGPGSAFEAVAQARVLGQVLGQDLDRDRAVEARVLRTVHLAHAASAETRQHFVRPELRAARQGHSRDPPGQ